MLELLVIRYDINWVHRLSETRVEALKYWIIFRQHDGFAKK